MNLKRVILRPALTALEKAGWELRRTRNRGTENIPAYYDTLFAELYRQHFSKTMVSLHGLYTAYQSAKYIVENNVPGDVVECGVWRGGCSILMAETCAAYGDTCRQFYLYDTFAGMSEPTELDKKSNGTPAQAKYEELDHGDYVDWCYGSLQEVTANVEASSYPTENFHLVQGKVEETIPNTIPQQIALLRLDTDWYESTKHELEHLYPLLTERGVLLIDDYGSWEGARQAVDEYFASHGDETLLWNIHGRLAGVKRTD